MTQFKFLFTFSLMLVILAGCDRNQNLPIVDPATEINAQITRYNSENDFTSTIAYIEEKGKQSKWRKNESGDIRLIQEITYNVFLENGEQVEIGLWLSKVETNKDLLVLKENDLKEWRNRSWDYKRTEDEIINFYEDLDDAMVMIDNTVISYRPDGKDFNLLKAKKAEVDSKEKTYLEISFEGEAYGWYDPYGEYMYFFELAEGIFKGIIE